MLQYQEVVEELRNINMSFETQLEQLEEGTEPVDVGWDIMVDPANRLLVLRSRSGRVMEVTLAVLKHAIKVSGSETRFLSALRLMLKWLNEDA